VKPAKPVHGVLGGQWLHGIVHWPGTTEAGLAGFLPALGSVQRSGLPRIDCCCASAESLRVGWPNSTGVGGARVFFTGRVVCGASRNGHEGEASTRFLIGQRRGAAPVGNFRPGPKTLKAPCITRRGVRAATGHGKRPLRASDRAARAVDACRGDDSRNIAHNLLNLSNYLRTFLNAGIMPADARALPHHLGRLFQDLGNSPTYDLKIAATPSSGPVELRA
jgi:hypothetical protein